MPGRATPPIPDSDAPQCASSAFTSVPVSLPGAGCAVMPAGLSTTIRCASSKSTVSGIASGSGIAGAGGGTAIR